MAKRGKKYTRAASRQSAPQARYDAAGQGRQLRAWAPSNLGPNRVLDGVQTIRNRTRDLDRNDWSAKTLSQKWGTTLIGVGITPRWRRIKSRDRRQQIIDLFNDQAAVIDADGALNIYAQQTLAVKEWFVGGEVFARRRYRRLTDGLPLPFQVQLMGSEMCPMLDADQWPGMPQGNKMRLGIERDRRNRIVAYWFFKEHPGDNYSKAVGTSDLVRVLAEDVIHMFEPDRAGATRGVPQVASVVTRIKNIGEFDDNVMTRQKLANMFVGFITRELSTSDFNPDVDPLTGQPIQRDAGGAIVGMQPGILQELDDGQDIKFANPPEAGTTYGDYMRTQQLGVAAAGGLPYELLSGDIREISDRTLRVLINELRRLAEQRQWQMVIPQFCQRVINWFAEAGLLIGKISAAEFDDVRRVEHAPHGWAYIHPVQDVQGKALEVEKGFRSRSSVIGERGDDPEQVDNERAEDKAREDELDLTPPPPAPVGRPANQDQSDPEDGESDQPKKE